MLQTLVETVDLVEMQDSEVMLEMAVVVVVERADRISVTRIRAVQKVPN